MIGHNKQEVRLMPSVVSQKDRDRFWSKVAITDNPISCWNWLNFTNRGYGTFRLGKIIYFAHRVAYFLHYGQDPLDKCCLHSCDNRMCSNPNHLSLGSTNDNFIDSVNKNRSVLAYGEDNHCAKLTESQVLQIIDECSKSDITYVKLAKKYGVNPVSVFNIIHGKTWKYLSLPRSKIGHPMPHGEDHKISKLTDLQILEIREKYSLGKGSYQVLANDYNVSNVTISNIVQNRVWRHLLSEKERGENTLPYNRYNKPKKVAI